MNIVHKILSTSGGTWAAQAYTYPATNSIGSSQTLFAPVSRTIQGGQHPHSVQSFTFGINGSLRKIETHAWNHNVEYYLFNSAANLKAYSNNGLDFAYYGYNASNTRTYKISMLNANTWVNGQPEPLHLQLQSAMFYPNAYINFNQNGEYTKHYYNGTERIASRLGDAQPESFVISSNDRLGFRIMQADEQARADLLELVEAGDVPIETPSVDVTVLQPTGTATDIFYYHTNHLGSTAFVTDQNRNVTQGFLYAPFGEITTEYNATFGNDIIPKYSFNVKELDEETGMYYYEARYYKPPVFTSRDPMMDQKPWLTPYHYCSNNPVGRLDPSGMLDEKYYDQEGNYLGQIGENTDVRVLNSTMNKEDAMTLIASGSEEAAATLMDNSVAFADYFTNVSDVTNGAAVVPYSKTLENGCFDAATQQMKNAGYGVYGSWNKSNIFTAVNNELGANPNHLSENIIGGAIRIMTDLRNGKPVMAGVYECDANGVGSLNTDNRNPMTGHFIVFNGVSVSNGNVSFNYMDNATRGKGSLNLNINTGVISGPVSGRLGYISCYIVSEVRKSYKIKK